jgi:hypothetical protein
MARVSAFTVFVASIFALSAWGADGALGRFPSAILLYQQNPPETTANPPPPADEDNAVDPPYTLVE